MSRKWGGDMTHGHRSKSCGALWRALPRSARFCTAPPTKSVATSVATRGGDSGELCGILAGVARSDSGENTQRSRDVNLVAPTEFDRMTCWPEVAFEGVGLVA